MPNGRSTPGPIGAVLPPQLTVVRDNPSLPLASTLCGACYDVCPVAIDIPTMLVHLRQEVVASAGVKPERVAMAGTAWLTRHPSAPVPAGRAAARPARDDPPVAATDVNVDPRP